MVLDGCHDSGVYKYIFVLSDIPQEIGICNALKAKTILVHTFSALRFKPSIYFSYI